MSQSEGRKEPRASGAVQFPPAREFYYVPTGEGPGLILCQSHNPALILLETFLPGLDTFAAAADIRQLRPAAKIAILTCHGEPALLNRARRARLNGFILKKDGFEELNYAIRTILKGGFYTPPSMSSVLVEPAMEMDPLECLTEREKSVFVLKAQSYQTKDIANALNISVKTAETHLNNIRRKPVDVGSLAGSCRSFILIGVGLTSAALLDKAVFQE